MRTAALWSYLAVALGFFASAEANTQVTRTDVSRRVFAVAGAVIWPFAWGVVLADQVADVREKNIWQR